MSKVEALREQVYQYVAPRLQRGDPPTLREVQAAMGFRAVETARNYLEALVREGRLIKRGTASRSYGLPPELLDTLSQRVPILGSVQAGALTLADQDPDGYLEVERRRHGEELFALKVRGRSMIGAGILPDDFVIARRQSQAQNGDIVVAVVGEEATVKRLRFASPFLELCPENPEFQTLRLPPKEVVLLGKVVEVRRYYSK